MNETIIVLHGAMLHPRDGQRMVDTLTCPRDGDACDDERGIRVVCPDATTLIPWANIRGVRYVTRDLARAPTEPPTSVAEAVDRVAASVAEEHGPIPSSEPRSKRRKRR